MFGFIFVGKKMETIIKAKAVIAGKPICEILFSGDEFYPKETTPDRGLLKFAQNDREKEILSKWIETNSGAKVARHFGISRQAVSKVKAKLQARMDKASKEVAVIPKSTKNCSLTLDNKNSLVFRVLVGAARCVVEDQVIMPSKVQKRILGESATKRVVTNALYNLDRGGFIEKITGTHNPTHYKLTDLGYHAAQDSL